MTGKLFAAFAAVVAISTTAYAAAPVAVPDLIWYRFDEPAGSTTTQNFAVPGAGFANAPVLGHVLGDGFLTGVGGGSATNFVNTGWNGAMSFPTIPRCATFSTTRPRFRNKRGCTRTSVSVWTTPM